MGAALRLLAVDLGASGGRAILGTFDGEKLVLQPLHKFANGPQRVRGHMYWDILRLWAEIKVSLQKAARAGIELDALGIDTWGVDYGLLDKNGQLLSNPYHYRDKRTDDVMPKVWEQVTREEIYRLTGIQFMQFNTLFQLYADLQYRPWTLEQAETLLFIPDLLNYFLTGQNANEKTIASTSQVLNATSGTWARDLLQRLGINDTILQDIAEPGQALGTVLPEVAEECGLKRDLMVMVVGSHDTASAVAATPLEAGKTAAFLSSGTWSLLGMEIADPIITPDSLAANFTNEAGVQDTIRFLKNISGLWLLQECRRIWQLEGQDLSYDEIATQAKQARSFLFRVDPDDPRFLGPTNMVEEIEAFCRETGQPIPTGPGEMARGIYESLAFSYRENLAVLERLTGQSIDTINMVGGGIQAELLCQITADITGRRVVTGPVEATAMGNMLVQLIGLGELDNLEQGRELIRRSVSIREYLPAAKQLDS